MRIEHTDKLFTEAALETYTANERGGIEPAVLDQWQRSVSNHVLNVGVEAIGT